MTIKLTREQSRRVDKIAMDRFSMSGLVLMENAGRAATDVLCGLGIDGPVYICCGRGNNAGDGLVIARHLRLRNYRPQVLFWADPACLTGDAAANYEILARTDVPIRVMDPDADPANFPQDADWLVDALLGTGAKGDPRPPIDRVIRAINRSRARRFAVDLPSGLDCDTGRPGDPTIRATATCTFVSAKVGFDAPEAAPYVGKLLVVDIGIPPEILDLVLSETR